MHRRLDALVVPEDQLRVECVIGVARVVVSAVALLGISIDHPQPAARYPSSTYAFGSTYPLLTNSTSWAPAP